MKFFAMVREVDPRYDGLEAQMSKAQEAVAKQKETHLLADLKATGRNNVHKRRDIYRELSQISTKSEYSRSFQQYQERAAEADKKAAQQRARAAQRASAQLQLIDWNWGTVRNFATAEGRVKNVSNVRLENIQAVVTFKTRDGTFITASDALIDFNPILPGQISNFKVMTRANPAMNKASIDFKKLMGGAVPWYKE